MNSIFFFLFFIIIILWIMFLWHYFIYIFLVRFFNITNNNIKIYIITAFFILWISFILSSIISNYFENIYTSYYYFLSWIWLWFLVNLNILILFLYILGTFLKKYEIYQHKLYFVVPMLFLWIIFSLYWVYNAMSPQIKNVEINIKNLPSSWKDKKIVMISDVHLGHVYDDSFLEKTTERINKLNPDIIFIVWDLFDWMHWSLEKYIQPINDLKPKDWIYYVTWNHETYLWVNETYRILSKTNIKILKDEAVNIDWVQLIWLSYPERGRFKDFKETLGKININKDVPKILLYHSPTHLNEAADEWIDLQLSWHTHRWQMFPFNFITSIVYAGHDYWLSNIWDFQIYISNWLWTWWPAIRTLSRSEIILISLK